MTGDDSFAIGPSLLAADPLDLRSGLRQCVAADFVHVDLFDDSFVQGISWGSHTLKAVVKESPVPVEAHLMVSAPRHWAMMAVDAGCTSVVFHIEAFADLDDAVHLAENIQDNGASPGIAISPKTDIDVLVDVADAFDSMLIMTVIPGKGGTRMLSGSVHRVAEAKKLLKTTAPHLVFGVDGGVTRRNIHSMWRAGAERFVVGTAVFGSSDPSAMIRVLRDERK